MPFTNFSSNGKTKDIAKIDAICDFLEVYIHSVLFYRKVYPKSLFEDRSALGIPVKSSRHPELSQYIFDAVSAVRAEIIQSKSGGDVMIEIIDGQRDSLESFVVELSAVNGQYSARHDIDLRAALIRLSTLEPGPELPPDSTFQVCFRQREGGIPTLEKNLWVPRLPGAQSSGMARGTIGDVGDQPQTAPTPSNTRLVPLGAVDDSELKVQVLALLRRSSSKGPASPP